MYFTREPIVETVITSKEGYKLVLRNSKGGQEEYCVDAVEVIAFGQHCFFRSLEKAKSFLLPVSDYEVLENRETKMVLKTPSLEKGIKIGGGREVALRPIKEIKEEDHTKESDQPIQHQQQQHSKENHNQEHKNDRKKERRRFRKRKEDALLEEEGTAPMTIREDKISLIPPPTTLISETISRYKDLPDYAGAFFAREDKENHHFNGNGNKEHHEPQREEISSLDEHVDYKKQHEHLIQELSEDSEG